jgi:hypothetical protein
MAKSKRILTGKSLAILNSGSNHDLRAFPPDPADMYSMSLPPTFEGVGIGFDPGRRYGLYVVQGVGCWGETRELSEEPIIAGVEAFWLGRGLQNRPGGMRWGPLVIEGPSYGDKFGVVDLERIRFGMYLGAHFEGWGVQIVPPTTIRSAVFGHAFITPSHVWDFKARESHVYDALACALFAAGWRYKEE